MYLNLINSVTPHKDCPDQDFSKLKHKAFSPIFWSGQFHLNSCTDFTSTWLCPKSFWSWTKNLGSLVPKHSELLASHHGDLRLEGHLYSYPFGVTLDSRVLWNWSRSVKYTPTFYLYAISASPCSLFKRMTNDIWHTMIYTWYVYRLSNSISFDRELI